MDAAYRAVRSSLFSRRTFFECLRVLMLFIPFDNWEHLMKFMLDRLGTAIPDSNVGT